MLVDGLFRESFFDFCFFIGDRQLYTYTFLGGFYFRVEDEKFFYPLATNEFEVGRLHQRIKMKDSSTCVLGRTVHQKNGFNNYQCRT